MSIARDLDAGPGFAFSVDGAAGSAETRWSLRYHFLVARHSFLLTHRGCLVVCFAPLFTRHHMLVVSHHVVFVGYHKVGAGHRVMVGMPPESYRAFPPLGAVPPDSGGAPLCCGGAPPNGGGGSPEVGGKSTPDLRMIHEAVGSHECRFDNTLRVVASRG